MDKFKELLESSVINDETRAILSEAWNEKLTKAKLEIKEEVESEVREEFKGRYENDKARLYEAMDSMISDAISNYSQEMIEETLNLKKEKEKLAKSIKEARATESKKIEENMNVFTSVILEELSKKVKSLEEEKAELEKSKIAKAKKDARTKEAKKEKMKETIENLQTFVLSKLSEEMNRVKEKEKNLEKEKEKIKEEARMHKISINEIIAERFKTFEKFMIDQLKEEITEYKDEQNKLAILRVKMVSESKEHLNNVRKEFVKRAASLIENTISSRMEHEISELKESIRIARENDFARTIFEDYKNIFMNSYLAEGTEIKKIENKMNDLIKELNEEKATNAEQKKLIENAQIRLNLSEERILRDKTLGKLLRPLNKDKRDVMENLLEGVKTKDLEESFYKYLNVLNEEKSPRKNTTILSETQNKRKPKISSVKVTGDKQKITESVTADKENEDEDRAEIRRLAGIRN